MNKSPWNPNTPEEIARFWREANDLTERQDQVTPRNTSAGPSAELIAQCIREAELEAARVENHAGCNQTRLGILARLWRKIRSIGRGKHHLSIFPLVWYSLAILCASTIPTVIYWNVRAAVEPPADASSRNPLFEDRRHKNHGNRNVPQIRDLDPTSALLGGKIQPVVKVCRAAAIIRKNNACQGVLERTELSESHRSHVTRVRSQQRAYTNEFGCQSLQRSNHLRCWSNRQRWKPTSLPIPMRQV